MKRAKHFHRKRPHILPPLPNFGPSELRPMDPLQPPDILLSGNRLGSPAPRRTAPMEPDDIFTPKHGKPLIKILEPSLTETEKSNIKIDIMSDEIFQKANSFSTKVKKTNVLRDCDVDSRSYDEENAFMENLTKKHQFEHCSDGLDKKLKNQEILPLEETENFKNFELKVLQIPNRYKPLKPIGQKTES